MLSRNDGSVRFDVSVIGLGAMGTIMARAFLRQGKRVAVWNRSGDKADVLVAEGAHRCETAAAALEASPVAVLVLLDNDAVHAMLSMPGVEQALAQRTIVNYTTNSKEDSIALQDLVHRAGGHFVKGVIVAYPRNVGHCESYCIHAGDRDAFERHRDLLQILAGHALFLTWDDAHSLSTTLHAHLFAAMFTFYEAVSASSHLGMPAAEAARLISDVSRFFIADAIADAARRFDTGNFASDQARLDVHLSAFDYMAEALHKRGAEVPIFDVVCEVTRRARSMGYGSQDISAAVKAFAPEGAVQSMPPQAR
ncbi:MAG: NAD(P)-binding domain-containing protein [Alphaproteobacteria bacterium]|nr:NAD(P)-binding domain-containing protein [Alphaproteobacteria bacterium]